MQDVAEGAPVFLTKNDCNKYVILCMQDYEKFQLESEVYCKLCKAETEATRQTSGIPMRKSCWN